MISFRQYLLEASDTKTGNYVQVKTSFPNIMDQMDVATGSKSKDPHITLVYSKESSVDKNKLLKSIQQSFKDYGVAEIIGADSFGAEDNKACIVLKLKSPQLNKINTALCSFGDIKHSYDEFSPHLTLFYGVNQEEADYWVKWLNMRIKGQMLEYKGFESTTIIDDWNESVLLEMPQLNKFHTKEFMDQMSTNFLETLDLSKKKEITKDFFSVKTPNGIAYLHIVNGKVIEHSYITTDNVQNGANKRDGDQQWIVKFMTYHVMTHGELKQDSSQTMGAKKLWLDFAKSSTFRFFLIKKFRGQSEEKRVDYEYLRTNEDEIWQQVNQKTAHIIIKATL